MIAAAEALTGTVAQVVFRRNSTFLDPLPIAAARCRRPRSCSPALLKPGAADDADGLLSRTHPTRNERGREQLCYGAYVEHPSPAEIPLPGLSKNPGAEPDSQSTAENPKELPYSPGTERRDSQSSVENEKAASVTDSTIDTIPEEAAVFIEGSITLMIRNIPYTVTLEVLQKVVDSAGFAGSYSELWIPPSRLRGKKFSNMGYGFIKFHSTEVANWFQCVFEGYHWSTNQCNRILQVTLAHTQD